ncbi:hypothetical protein BRAO375_1220019 [Bradyrhizobium sp. ORS 375]|nr:hypothetical protein BRAO375_1220019 [Bradyrhizobium sp. ORS 375]
MPSPARGEGAFTGTCVTEWQAY